MGREPMKCVWRERQMPTGNAPSPVRVTWMVLKPLPTPVPSAFTLLLFCPAKSQLLFSYFYR